MPAIKLCRIVVCAGALVSVAWEGVAAQHAAREPGKRLRAMTPADIGRWRRIEHPVLANNGQWFAYTLRPQEGAGEAVVRATGRNTEWRVPGVASAVGFSEDSRWIAFATEGTRPSPRASARSTGAPADSSAVTLLELATGQRTRFSGAQRFAFSTNGGGWLVLYTPEAGSAGALDRERADASDTVRAHASDTVRVGPTETRPTPLPRGVLTVRQLTTGRDTTLSDIGEFALDSTGRWLAWTTVAETTGPRGGTAALRLWDLAAGAGSIRTLDEAASGVANPYRQITWSANGDRLTVLRSTTDGPDAQYALVAFWNFSATRPARLRYEPSQDPQFPAGMAISPQRPLRWTADRGAILFGIRPIAPAAAPDSAEGARQPTVAVWHWRDVRLPPQQAAEHAQDTSFSYAALFRVAERRFVRLADDSVRDVVVPARLERWVVGIDLRAYAREANLTGIEYADIYAIDLETGRRRLVLSRHLTSEAAFPFRQLYPSPTGARLLFWRDGHFHVYDFERRTERNLTAQVPTSFLNAEEDRPRTQPPVEPVGFGPDKEFIRLGWARDSRSVLLYDGWDVWQVLVDGAPARNLTRQGRKEQVRWQHRLPVGPRMPSPKEVFDEAVDHVGDGVDLTQPLYFAPLAEWTKQGGLARLDVRSGKLQTLLWGDAAFGGYYASEALLKARDADVFVYARETSAEFPDYYVTDHTFKHSRRLTDANPQQRELAWTPGPRIVEYKGPNSERLQATLFLPAGYVPGRAYPTVVVIYERRSGRANRFNMPEFFLVSRSWYTSNGYAVLEPDISYRVNDPFVSATHCTLAALEAAIATGVVDRARVGLAGHSFGGFETNFIITQTNAFRAAVASAGGADLFSQYNDMYWSTGRPASSIYERDQIRFDGPFWGERFEAYQRNTAILQAPKVTTPLLMIANDKDEAVSWHQGIQYFNALRRLGKPVILLQYLRERHAEFANPANLRDYGMRIKQFFDHYLKDEAPAPWITGGEPARSFERYP